MRLTVTTFTSLDGVMQGPGGPDEDRTGGFRLGGWLVPFADEDFGRIIDQRFAAADEILFGRTTYDMMYEYWSQVTEPDNAVATALNTLPKHVATTRPGRELQVHGSHGLIQTLLDAGLIDELQVLVFPVVVGDGKRLFGTGARPTSMKLVSNEVTGTGVVVSIYEPVGELELHSYAVVDGKETVVE